jgi:hypothetical protein
MLTLEPNKPNLLVDSFTKNESYKHQSHTENHSTLPRFLGKMTNLEVLDDFDEVDPHKQLRITNSEKQMSVLEVKPRRVEACEGSNVLRPSSKLNVVAKAIGEKRASVP